MDPITKIICFIALLGVSAFVARAILAAFRRNTREGDHTSGPLTGSLSEASSFPTWTFNIPADVANQGFSIAIFGKDPSSGNWLYWNGFRFVPFSASDNGMDRAPLIKAVPDSHNNFTISLPSSQDLSSGVVAMFIGSSSGIPVSSGIPGSPTAGSNPGDVFSIFELTYSTAPSLDIDISNVDQVGFTYTVKSSNNAPFPLAEVGSPIARKSLFDRFGNCFPAKSPFHGCLKYGTVGGKQVRLLAPQDVLSVDPQSKLATWFDVELSKFYDHYKDNVFQLYQTHQYGPGQNGTMWTGKVQTVTPQKGHKITTSTYIDQNGDEQPINATWQWGDGTKQYRVLQLVGNAYHGHDLSKSPAKGDSGLTAGEYEGAVVNIYSPLHTVPSWVANGDWTSGQQVFGCSGVFATGNDPDAVIQANPGLALNALTNLENVIVSALNRGVATGYGFKVQPQQYTGLYAFSQAPVVTPVAGDGGDVPHPRGVPAGTHTYYLTGVLNNGDESVLSWSQTVHLSQPSKVQLFWLPQPNALYKAVNVYRQKGSGPVKLVKQLANGTPPSMGYTDDNTDTQDSEAPYTLYPSWNHASGADYVPSNLFSAFLHQNWNADPTTGISINGLCYGYPFDDQGSFSTNIGYGGNLPDSVFFAISKLS